jgi:hypothetical protein
MACGFDGRAAGGGCETLSDALRMEVGVVTMNRLLPGLAYDAVIRRQYGLPG